MRLRLRTFSTMALKLVLPFLFPLLFAVKHSQGMRFCSNNFCSMTLVYGLQDVTPFFVFSVTNDCCPHTHSAGACTHRYLLEPWTNTELASCNPHGSHNLTTVCSVTASESSFTLEWYYSKSRSSAGHSGDILNSVREKYFVEPIQNQLLTGAFRILSHLTIMNVTPDDFGYYWCMVRVRNQGTLLPNPSTILHLGNVCASAPVCNSSIQLYRDWPNDSCANHDTNNITLPEMLQCNQSTSTPDNVTSIRSSRTAHPMDSSATLPLQTVTGKSGGDNIIRATGLEDIVKTIMLHVLSPSSTVVYTEPLPTDVVSDSDSDTQLNWLYVGIAMAIVLTAIAVILILIICIQCKKRRVKGKYMSASERCVSVHSTVWYHAYNLMWACRNNLCTNIIVVYSFQIMQPVLWFQ